MREPAPHRNGKGAWHTTSEPEENRGTVVPSAHVDPASRDRHDANMGKSSTSVGGKRVRGTRRALDLSVDLVKLSAPSLARTVKQRATRAAASKQQQLEGEQGKGRGRRRSGD